MKKYKVHLFPVVHLPAIEVEADNQEDALTKADEIWFDKMSSEERAEAIKQGEYSEELKQYLVDEVGDKEHEKSTWYMKDHEPF
jgi:nicotinate-nucleotide pyrophosphorylase